MFKMPSISAEAENVKKVNFDDLWDAPLTHSIEPVKQEAFPMDFSKTMGYMPPSTNPVKLAWDSTV